MLPPYVQMLKFWTVLMAVIWLVAVVITFLFVGLKDWEVLGWQTAAIVVLIFIGFFWLRYENNHRFYAIEFDPKLRQVTLFFDHDNQKHLDFRQIEKFEIKVSHGRYGSRVRYLLIKADRRYKSFPLQDDGHKIVEFYRQIERSENDRVRRFDLTHSFELMHD